MGVKGEEPTAQQIETLRERVRAHMKEHGEGVFDSRDVGRIMVEDFYVKRWYMHVWDEPGDQLEKSSEMLINALKWRKEQGVRDIGPNNLNEALLDKGVIFLHGEDKEGKKILVMHGKKYLKGKDNIEEAKRLFLYYVERADRQTRGDKISFMMDLKDAGLKNLDMEYMQFTINVFKLYAPWMLNYILIYEMPWVLNAAYKIIKSWLPAEGVRLIKFLTKANIGGYVADEIKLPQWGGTILDWEYEFEEEQPLDYPEYEGRSAQASNGMDATADSDQGEDGRRKVHFDVKMRASPSDDSVISHSSTPSRTESMSSQRPSREGANLLQLTPDGDILFKQSKDGDFFAEVRVTNISSGPVVFKIKTTSPENMGSLASGGDSKIEIYVQSKLVSSASSLVKDKFLITVISVDKDGHSNASISDMMKSKSADAQYRLRCTLASDEPSVAAVMLSPRGSGAPNQPSVNAVGASQVGGPQKMQKQVDSMSKKIGALVESNEELQNSVQRMQYIMYGLIGLLMVLFITLMWRTSGLCIPPSFDDFEVMDHQSQDISHDDISQDL